MQLRMCMCFMLLAVLVGPVAPSAAAPPNAPDWGSSPPWDDDWAETMPEFPLDLSGTVNYLGPHGDEHIAGQGAGIVFVATRASLLAFRVADGALLWQFMGTPQFCTWHVRCQLCSDSVVVLPDYGPRLPLELDLATGQTRAVLARPEPAAPQSSSSRTAADEQAGARLHHALTALPTEVFKALVGPVLVGDRLCAVARGLTDEHGPGPGQGDTALLCLNLDKAGLPLPGELRILRQPQRFDALAARFMASAAPLADAVLMIELVQSGVRGINRVMEQLPVDDTVHWSAIAQALRYAEMHHLGGGLDSGFVLTYHLVQRGAKSIPALLVLLTEPALACYEERLRNLLGSYGGPAADRYLVAHSPLPASTPLAIAPVPYRLAPPEPYAPWEGAPADSRHYNFFQWSEARTGDGARYVAFNHTGLLNVRDIYLGIDQDGDGAFEQILPTGLLDDCATIRQQEGYFLFGAQGPLTLTLDLPAVNIAHHALILDPRAPRSPLRASGVTKPVDRVQLADLERDSDGDGLTDVAERLLHTNPAAADSDGDGVPDNLDPAPLSNPRDMGPRERAVVRAFAYAYQGQDPVSDEGTGDNAQFPFNTRYFVIDGANPVDFAYGGYRCVWLRASAIPSEVHYSFNLYSLYSAAVTVREPDRGYETGVLDAVRQISVPLPPTLEVDLDFPYNDREVELQLVDGEYYPVSSQPMRVS